MQNIRGRWRETQLVGVDTNSAPAGPDLDRIRMIYPIQQITPGALARVIRTGLRRPKKQAPMHWFWFFRETPSCEIDNLNPEFHVLWAFWRDMRLHCTHLEYLSCLRLKTNRSPRDMFSISKISDGHFESLVRHEISSMLA